MVVTARLGVRIGLVGGGLFGTEAAGLVGVMSVVADQVLALVGDVLGQFSQEVEGLEDLEVAGGSAEQVGAGRFGEALRVLLLGAVDDLPGTREANDAARLNGQRAMYWARRWMPERSPASSRMLRSTPKPVWRQDRIWETTSGAIRLASRSRRKTLFSQSLRNGWWPRFCGRGRKWPSGVKAPSVTRPWM